jgi:hypothetical protein
MSDDADKPTHRASDIPMDLRKERETFVRSFMKRGVELTEELLGDNDELRSEIDRLRDENLRLRSQVASDDAIRNFVQTIDTLELDKRTLLSQTNELREVNVHDANRFAEVESELNDLANLYIAAYQLHASLSIRRVLRHIQDMLGQLLGAYGFAIYVLDASGKRASPIASENLPTNELLPIDVGEGPIGVALLTGVARIPDEISTGTLAQPFAVVPMMVGDHAVGVITIVTMLEQKSGWATVDSELFKLLSEHAGPALVAANLYAGASGAVSALDDLADNLKRRSASVMPAAAEGE